MKSIVVILVLSLFALSEARYFKIGYDQQPLPSNPNKAYASRIVNGEPADIAEFPHMLVLLDLTVGGFICGASIISRTWTLSAAHCLEFNVPANLINFRAGSTNRLSGGTVYIAASYHLHPQYNTRTLEFDVAVARTTEHMDGINITPVALPPICNTICCTVCENVAVTTSGWGRNEAGIFPANLMQLTKPVHEFNDCVRIWATFRIVITEDSFCKSAFDNRDTCNGDSGSPLVIGEGANRVQVGVVR
ncbi:hypothetical protein ACKWTF_009399 [Chironomus riparius]